MNEYQPPDELVSLAAQLADGELSEAEHEVLRGYIAENPEHAAWFVEWMELNAMLQLDLGNMNHIGLTPRPLLPTEVPEIRNADAAAQANVLNNQAGAVQPRRRTARNQLADSKAWLTIACGLLLAITFLLGFTAARLTGLSFGHPTVAAADGESADQEIATIAGGVDAEFGDGVSLGSRLKPGTLRLNKGIAQVVFDRGAVVVLQGPAELELVDAGECRLVSGSLAADVVPDANGFSVGAGDLQIFEHDARFGLRTGPQMATEVHAFGGGLDLVGFRDADGLKRRLAEGEAIRWQGGAAATGISLDPNAFVTSQELARRQQLSEQRSYHRWLDYSKRWLHDPFVVLRYEFSPSADGASVNTVDPAAHVANSRQSAAALDHRSLGRQDVDAVRRADGRARGGGRCGPAFEERLLIGCVDASAQLFEKGLDANCRQGKWCGPKLRPVDGSAWHAAVAGLSGHRSRVPENLGPLQPGDRRGADRRVAVCRGHGRRQVVQDLHQRRIAGRRRCAGGHCDQR